jgi:hypothetical protein
VSFLEQSGPNAPKPTGVWVPARTIVLAEGTSAADAAKATSGKVLVIADGVARAREVQLAEIRDSDRRISAGLKPSEQIVSDPTKVRDGQRVTVADAAKAP